MGLFDRFRRGRGTDVGQRARSETTASADPASWGPSAAAQPQPTRSIHAPLPPGLISGPRFAVVDVETTGLSATSHRILEIAVVTTDACGRVLDEWATRINPQGPVGATHIHGITAADVAHAPAFDQVIADLTRRLAGAAVCAHNARFDLAFLRAEYARAGWRVPFVPALCTLEASTHHLPHLERRRLADCCWAVGAPLTNAHSALGDARATAGLLAAFMNPDLGVPPRPADLGLLDEALRVTWPTEKSATPLPMPGAGRRLSDQAMRNIAAQAAKAPSKPLVQLVERFSLVDALDEGAPDGAIAYLEKLAEVLEDGVLTVEEATDLHEVAEFHELDAHAIAQTNRAFVLALAHEAVADGKVTRAEKAELLSAAELLDVESRSVSGLLDRAEAYRHGKLGAGLPPLPHGWPHGEPLRVGNRVVFTGCDPDARSQLEQRSEAAGVRVMNNVASTTAMLVTDGTMEGTKLDKARALRTRIVHPDEYRVLLDHLQPAARPASAPGRTAIPTPDVTATTASETASDLEAGVIPAPRPESPTLKPDAWADLTPAMVRAWARDNGWEVGVRGRLPASLLDAYRAAHTPNPAPDPAAPGVDPTPAEA